MDSRKKLTPPLDIVKATRKAINCHQLILFQEFSSFQVELTNHAVQEHLVAFARDQSKQESRNRQLDERDSNRHDERVEILPM